MGRLQPPTSDVVIEFSLGGARRRLHCSPLFIGVAGGLLGLMTLGVIGGGCYLTLRDDPHASFASGEKQTQLAYESRIASLRRRIEELATRQFVDRDGVEGMVQSLARRQAQLEARATAVAQLVERTQSGGAVAVASAFPAVTAATRPQAGEPARATARPVAALVDETLELRLGGGAKPTPLPPSDAGAASPGGPATSAALAPAADPAAPVSQRLQSLAASLDRVARDQRQRLSSIMRPALEEAARLRRVFNIAGVPVSRYLTEPRRARAMAEGVGGPYISARETDDAGGRFETDLALAQSAVATLDGLRRALPATPVRAPLDGPLQPTSSFGYRADPFLGRPALHSGVDLRDRYGAPVRTAAGGVVAAAGPRGGYGNLVEIDHGDGVSTRYGHLSEIDVAPGQPVKPGATIGRVGSTGRSTGPHLHYEVRIDGEAVDPTRFLEAAAVLARVK